jgi:uncharacterized protein with HEPN domain
MSALQPDDHLYLRHILDAIAQTQEYLGSVTAEQFRASRLLQDAVIRNLEVVGEAAKRLSPECKAAAPSVPWRRVTGMRDKLIHDYMGVDVTAVWDTVEVGLPVLRAAVIELLE